MAFDPASDSWSVPCDLCGGVSFKTMRLPIHASARRCRECGLITLSRSDGGHNASGKEPGDGHSAKAALHSSRQTLRETLMRAVEGGARTLLLIGIEGLPLCVAAKQAGMDVTILAEPGTEAPDGIVVHTMPVEQAPFLPDQFDVVLCVRTVESFGSPALLFEKCRLWLASGGLLLLGGMNAGSMGAKLWPKTWLRRNATRANYLISGNILRNYADRYGYDVRSLHTYSRLDTVAVDRSEGVSLLTRALLAPLTVISTLLGMGDEIFVELEKRGVAVRPMPSRVAERETAPALAPAMYTSARTEAVVCDP